MKIKDSLVSKRRIQKDIYANTENIIMDKQLVDKIVSGVGVIGLILSVIRLFDLPPTLISLANILGLPALALYLGYRLGKKYWSQK